MVENSFVKALRDGISTVYKNNKILAVGIDVLPVKGKEEKDVANIIINIPFMVKKSLEVNLSNDSKKILVEFNTKVLQKSVIDKINETLRESYTVDEDKDVFDIEVNISARGLKDGKDGAENSFEYDSLELNFVKLVTTEFGKMLLIQASKAGPKGSKISIEDDDEKTKDYGVTDPDYWGIRPTWFTSDWFTSDMDKSITIGKDINSCLNSNPYNSKQAKTFTKETYKVDGKEVDKKDYEKARSKIFDDFDKTLDELTRTAKRLWG